MFMEAAVFKTQSAKLCHVSLKSHSPSIVTLSDRVFGPAAIVGILLRVTQRDLLAWEN